METLTLDGIYFVFIIIVSVFAIGSFLALPWIWYHTGYISKKLSRIIELLEGEKTQKYDLNNNSAFKGLTKDEAIQKWRNNHNDKRSWGEIVKIWEQVNKTNE